MENEKKDSWDKAKIISQIFLTIAIIYYGHVLNGSLREREIDLELVKMGIGILSTKPNENTSALREWAVTIVDNYSGVPLSKNVKSELMNAPIPQHIGVVTMGGKTVTMGGKVVTFGSDK